jgi:hypothetical protein
MKRVGEEDMILTSTGTIQMAPDSDHEIELGTGQGRRRREWIRCAHFAAGFVGEWVVMRKLGEWRRGHVRCQVALFRGPYIGPQSPDSHFDVISRASQVGRIH